MRAKQGKSEILHFWGSNFTFASDELFTISGFIVLQVMMQVNSTANKYDSPVGHHEQKKQKTTGQIKFSAATIKQKN